MKEARTVFTPAEPRRALDDRLLSYASTWTWSDGFRDFLSEHAAALDRIRPRLRTVRGAAPYADSYDTSIPSGMRPHLDAAADALLRLRPGRELLLFTRMLAPRLTSNGLHSAFALLRRAVVDRQHDPRAALHSPVPTTRADNSDFLLHADLFSAKRIWLIFDDVPRDGSGASLLLPARELGKALQATVDLPRSHRQRLRALLSRELQRDGFDELYNLLHGAHPWRTELAARLTAHQFTLAFRPGEGYLCNDRRWLHGRAPVHGSVRARRFHRLIF